MKRLCCATFCYTHKNWIRTLTPSFLAIFSDGCTQLKASVYRQIKRGKAAKRSER